MPTQRTTDRYERWPKSRDYVLGSFFGSLLTTLTDPKDWKAMIIKSDPVYFSNTKRTTDRSEI